MKFIIERELLLSTLQNVSKGLSQKTPMPVLTGIYISVNEDKITFITTNKEIAVKIELEKSEKVRLYETGECVVPGKYFLDIVRKVEGKDVDFTLFEKNSIKILSDRSDFTLVAYDKTDYPKTNFLTDVTPIIFDSKELKQIVRETSFACASAETRIAFTRIVLSSLNFKAKNGLLEIVATDSFRLAKKVSKIATDVEINVNIPSKSLDEFCKILDEESTVVKVYLENSKVIFEYKNIVFVTRLIEGNYPDTSSLFPNESLFVAEFDRNELINAVDRASLFNNSESVNIVKFSFTSANKAEISSNSTEIGKVVEEIYLENNLENVNFQTAFSTKYLLEALRAFEKDKVSLYFTGEIKPALIKEQENDTLTQLLLPVRVF